jgi:nucleoside-diphosphate-sugar epimerase
MRVFLTGGSGYIGRSVLRILAAQGAEVTALARSDRSARTVADLGATPVRGDLTDTAVLREAAANTDAVIHLGSDLTAETARVDLAAARALQAGLAGRGAYVHTGGVWVYGDTDGVVDEDAPQKPPAITAWRRANEDAVLADTGSGGRPVLVMPGVVYGGSGGLTRFFYTDPGRTNGAVPLIGDGANHWALVHVEDIADLYVRALRAAPGSVYAGVSGVNPTQAEIAHALSQAAGCPGSIDKLTRAEALERMGPIAEAFALDQQMTPERARRELGWTPGHTDPLAELATEQAA